MNQNYKHLIGAINNRINPDNLPVTRGYEDDLVTLSYSDVVAYVKAAMKGVSPEYTARSREAGSRVKDHLQSVLSGVDFRYQGSVMTDTHIMAYSDIDLLVIGNRFYYYDHAAVSSVLEKGVYGSPYTIDQFRRFENVKNSGSYLGNAIEDLRSLRLNSEVKLRATYESCDISNGKAIKVSSKSLNRNVDVVIANYYSGVVSILNGMGEYQGVQIYNKNDNTRSDPDYPFVSIDRINEVSSRTNGRLKRMIRFLKNIKAKSTHNIEISSFDINAICYSIDPNQYFVASFLELVPVLLTKLQNLCLYSFEADKLVSVDGREFILKNNPYKIGSVKLLLGEVEGIYKDLKSEGSL